ncbi:hypothetical protein MMC34_006096 [Xylographa carneopallida]|nr:hypothetical protein [Xylographa carneopallida]
MSGLRGKAASSPQILDHLANTSPRALLTRDVTLCNLRPQIRLSEVLLPQDSPSRIGSNVLAGKEPLSSGFTSPNESYMYARNPEITPVPAVHSDFDEDDCHSTHGVPYIIAPRVALRTPQYHRTNVDAWLDELVGPTTDPCSMPLRKPSSVPALSDTGIGHDPSSPTTQIVTRKMRKINKLKTIRRPAQPSTTAEQAPLYLNVVPRRSKYLDTPGSSQLRTSPVRNSSNKENLAPPTVALSWSSVASFSDRGYSVDGYHLQSPAAHAPRTFSGKADAISHPTFSTPSTLCSPDHSKKLRQKGTSYPNTSQIDECFGTARSAIHLWGQHGLPSVVLPFGEDLIDQTDKDINEDPNAEAEVLPLSPSVEKYRNGRGPRLGRCNSYWDVDILPEFSPVREAVTLQQQQIP